MPNRRDESVSKITEEWLRACLRHGRISRNTIAVGLVIIDRLREKCPLTPTEIRSGGGEIRGSRSRLGATLEKYDIPRSFLREVTTRQAHQDGIALLEQLGYGTELSQLNSGKRDEQLLSAIRILQDKAREWLQRQNLGISCDRQLSAVTWVRLILQEGKGKSGGKVEQHLVGAKLQTRHPNRNLPSHPAHAGDLQTGRSSDFDMESLSYHVTANPGIDVIKKCKANMNANRRPVLIVPAERVQNAKTLAEIEGIADRVTILALEDFVAQNVMEISADAGRNCYATLQEIIKEYNRRIEESETDMALKIELL